MPVRNQTAVRLAQYLVRITTQLQGMRQDNGIHGVGHDRPVLCISCQPRLRMRQGFDTLYHMVRYAAVFQRTVFPGWIDHDQVVTKQVRQLRSQCLLLGICQQASQRTAVPGTQGGSTCKCRRLLVHHPGIIPHMGNMHVSCYAFFKTIDLTKSSCQHTAE